jgi:predicted TIM-barrel fold metal-dependent hydrolase
LWRVSGHPYTSQVLMTPQTSGISFGNPHFDPLYDAAARNGLPVATHLMGWLHLGDAGDVADGPDLAGPPRRPAAGTPRAELGIAGIAERWERETPPTG